MSFTVISRSFDPPPFSPKEILRYAGCKGENGEVLRLMEECIKEAENKLSYRVCFCKMPVSIREKEICFGAFSFTSVSLAKNLENCKEAVFFAATVGIELDRLIERYSRISPTKALLMDAIGAERIEALCDAFCQKLADEARKSLAPRFSPGYGDLPIEVQKDVFSLLGSEKRIGLVLNDSFLMSPSKSVTAIVGLRGK